MQVVLCSQEAGITGTTQQPERLDDADRSSDQLRWWLMNAGHTRLMEGRTQLGRMADSIRILPLRDAPSVRSCPSRHPPAGHGGSPLFRH